MKPSPHYQSTGTRYYNQPDPSRYLDRKLPDPPRARTRYPGKRRESHYMDNVGSYYHSTHDEHLGKQSVQNHVDDTSSEYPSSRSGYHDEGSRHQHRTLGQNIQKHTDDTNSKHLSSRSKRHNEQSKHQHKTIEQNIQAKSKHARTKSRKELREQLFHQALQPFSTKTGTPYPCTQTDIDFHRQNIFLSTNPGPFIPVREATKEIMWQNDPQRTLPPDEKAAIKRLLHAATAAQDGLILGPDLAIKAFRDLDTVFFGGRLHHHATVTWTPDLGSSSTGDSSSHTRQIWGICLHHQRRAHSRIQLNARMIFKEAWTKRTPKPFESMIGTLLHEMCHAYENVRSPHDREQGSSGHGRLFGTRIAVVHTRAERLLGLWAIEHGEPHRQHHFFMPGCMDGRSEDQIGVAENGSSEGSGFVATAGMKNGAGEKKEGEKGTYGSGGGGRHDGKKQKQGQSRLEGAGKRADEEKKEKKTRNEAWKLPKKRPKEGADCVIM